MAEHIHPVIYLTLHTGTPVAIPFAKISAYADRETVHAYASTVWVDGMPIELSTPYSVIDEAYTKWATSLAPSGSTNH